MASFFKTTIVCILICLDISLLVASTVDFSEVGRGSTKRFCGKMLTDALALICNNEYQSFITNPIAAKRSDESIDDFAYNDQPAGFADDLPIQYQTYAYLSKIAPESIGLRSRVRREWYIRRGVYDECCRKPCSIHELKSYCKSKSN